MAQQNLDFGTGADNDGEFLNTAFPKIEANFDEIYALLPAEANATADQTGAEIKALYEAEANTNAYTDTEKTKLANIEESADVTDATNVDAAGATMNTDTDVSGNSWVLDEDTLVSNDATKVPTQQSVKAYVDAQVSSGSVSDGDKGDITVSGSGTVWIVDNDVVTYAKMQNVSATDKLLGRSTAGAGDVEEIACTAFGRSLIDDADAATARATLGNVPTLAGSESLTNKTIDGDNNTLSNLDIGNEVDWAAATDVADRTAFASGDKLLIFEDGVGLRKIDYTDLPGAGGGLSNVVEDTTPQLGGQLDVNGFAIGDGTLELLKFSETASAVNEVTVTNAATGNAPSLSATGDDTNIDLNLSGKGSGVVNAGGNRVLTTADEGTGNGLDADTVDGNEASALLSRANHTGDEPISALDIDGGTDIGADLTDSDLIIVDDGAGGTNRKCAMSRVNTYVSGKLPVFIAIACSDETTDLTTGTAKATFRMPFAMTLTDIRASVTTAPVGSTIIVDVNESGSTIMTTNKISIDASEKTSETAATAPGITDTALADDAEITIDIDQVGSSTAGAGLKVYLIGTRA